MDMAEPQATHAFLESVMKLSRKMRTAFDQQAHAHGLTYPRARALFRLARGQTMTQTELASELDLEQPTLARLLDRMEEHDLIERRPDPRDRRVNLVVLTVYGEEQADFVRSLADEIRNRMFEGIETREVEASIDVVERVIANLAEMENTPERSPEDSHVTP